MAGWQKIIAVSLAVGLVLILVLMPKQPAEVRNRVTEAPSTEGLSKIERAVQLVQGDNPMEGIMLLREVLEEDSTNVEAHFYLGLFSVQSGQYDKARSRFETVLRYEPENLEAHWQLAHLDMEEQRYAEAAENYKYCVDKDPMEFANGWFFMGKALELSGDDAGALKAYETYKPLTNDTIILKKLDEFINTLKQRINN